MARKKDQAARRQQLVSATIELIADRGIEALTLGTVAVIVLLTLAGLWLGSLERRREAGAVTTREDIGVGPA